jgi:hypothetical protein
VYTKIAYQHPQSLTPSKDVHLRQPFSMFKNEMICFGWLVVYFYDAFVLIMG